MTTKTKAPMTLSKDEIATFPKRIEEWVGVGRSTEPLTPYSAEAAVLEMFGQANLKVPRAIVFVDSPLVGALVASLGAELLTGADKPDKIGSLVEASAIAISRDVDAAFMKLEANAAQELDRLRQRVQAGTHELIHQAVGGGVYAAVEAGVGKGAKFGEKQFGSDSFAGKLRDGIIDGVERIAAQSKTKVKAATWLKDRGNKPITWHDWHGGAQWPAYCAWLDAMLACFPQLETPLLRAYINGARQCSYYWMNDEFAIMCKRPTSVGVDDRARLHNDMGPAIGWPDGFALWRWHGFEVEPRIIMQPESITVEQIRKHQNAETRRIMIERYGRGRYLVDTGAKVVDTDTVPIDALAPRAKTSIFRALMEDQEGRRWLVGSDGSTERVYQMEVDQRMRTCQEAHISLLPPGCPQQMLMES